METFAEKLKRLRNEKMLSQSQLAEKIYVSRSAVAKWEQGRGFPSVDSLQLISAEFCVTIDELVSDKEVEILKIQKDKKLSLRTKLLIALSVILAVIIAIGATLAVMYYPRKLSKYIKFSFDSVNEIYLEYYEENLEDFSVKKELIYLDKSYYKQFLEGIKSVEIVPEYFTKWHGYPYWFHILANDEEIIIGCDKIQTKNYHRQFHVYSGNLEVFIYIFGVSLEEILK